MSPNKARSGASVGLLIVALLCTPLAARAAEKTQVQADLVVEQDWDSNIFATKSDETSSYVTILRPSLGFANVGELGRMRLNGWLSSHTYWSQSEMNGIDRGVSADLDRKLTPRFSIFGNGSLQYYAKINEVRGDIVTQNAVGEPVVTPDQIVEGNAPDVNIQQGVGGFRYALTPLTELELSGGPYAVNYGKSPASDIEIRDRDGWFAGLSLGHQLTPLDKLSLSLSASNNDQDDVASGTAVVFDPATPIDEPLVGVSTDLNTGKSRSDQQSLTLGWQRQWSPVWSSSVAVGVRRLHTEVTGATRGATEVVVPRVCIPIVGGFVCIPTDPTDPVKTSPAFTENDFDDTGPGIVGEFRLTRSFLRSALSLGYSRETRSTSSAVTSDVNVDTFSLQYTHLLAERVTLRLNGDYELYGTANDSPSLVGASYVVDSFDPGDPASSPSYACQSGKLIETGSGASKLGQCETSDSNALHSQFLVLSARLDWQLRKRLGTFAVFRYYDRSGDELLFGNDYNKFNFGVGFRYNWDLDL